MTPDSPTDVQVARSLQNTTATGNAGSSNSSTDSPKAHAFPGVLQRKPSLVKILTRVRSTSRSLSGSQRSRDTVKLAESTELAKKSPSNLLGPESPSTKSQNLRNLAPWDRTVDVVYHQYPRGVTRPNSSLYFERSLNLFLREHGRKRTCAPRGYFALPSALRFGIWKHVMESDPNDRPVALTIAHWNKDVWRQGEFLTLQQATKDLQSCFKVSFQFRADALLSFLMEKRFHITYSPCIRPLLNPIATKWVEKYSPYMQDIALEIVLTEYRFGMNPSAHLLAPATTNLERLIENFVHAQLKRQSTSTLKSLVVLCRRFYGKRQAYSRTHSAEISGGRKHISTRNLRNFGLILETDESFYCPNNYLAICDPIKKLRGLIDSVRVCGFSQPYTFSLIQSLFSTPSTGDLKFHSYDVAPSTVWPQLEGQEAQVDEGGGRLKTQECSGLPDGGDESSWGAVQLPAPIGGERGTDWMEKQVWLRQVMVQK